ncbi:hypothetical protein [Actinoplanes aureus]|jgi:hypothetical protein|uniref:Uncharacterized protein n=1 Tax=Actinoplanes aureus TaxID=2792083 RepID=A0A931G542_9ACTN|nr:hypothetical protein [Actinoplanes aureus]MBG0568546.1 hypothetical protein [Actinoplanes aureus]
MNARPPTDPWTTTFQARLPEQTCDQKKCELFAGQEREVHQEQKDYVDPTTYAEVRFEFRESVVHQGPPPSESAEVWFTAENGIGARASGRQAGHLLAVTGYAVTVAGIVWGPKAVVEMAGVALPGWVVLGVVLLQIGGLGWLGRKLMRRKL